MKNLFKKQRENDIKKNKEKYLVDAQGKIVEGSKALKEEYDPNNLMQFKLGESNRRPNSR